MALDPLAWIESAIGGFCALLWSTVQLQEVPLHQTIAVRTVSWSVLGRRWKMVLG